VAGLHLVLAMHPAMLRCASCSEPLVHLEADPLGGPGHGAPKLFHCQPIDSSPGPAPGCWA